jgi:fructose-bisphosphate aldolase class II
MLTPLKKIVLVAHRHGYGVPAFNVANLEMTLGVIRAAVAQKSPIIIQVTEGTLEYAGLHTITSLIMGAIKEHSGRIPMAIHLDHGKQMSVIGACVKAGFSSVHMDASEFDFKKNSALTRKAVAYAHRYGVFAQGELGSIVGKEGMTAAALVDSGDARLTDPSQAAQFVRETGVDTLAVSVGTMHGLFQGKEYVDLARICAVAKAIPKIPLVLHGASGINDADLRAAIKAGIRIVNIDTSLREVFTKKLKDTVKGDLTFYDPRKILTPSIEAVTAVAIEKIKAVGAVGKA